MSLRFSREKYRAALFCATMLAGVGAAIGASAQATDSTGKVEEVVVTARKRTEKLQDVPVTVSALSSKTIEKLEIKNVFDLSQVTPGVYYGTSGGRNGGNKLQIRNFSTGTAGPSKASVFIDGVYSPGDYSSIPLANLDRIEVLKGPQSAYFGRATEVGAVNFITRDPTNDFSGNIDLVNASLNEHDYTGFISAPIIKDVLKEQITFRDYSFAGPSQWRTSDGYHLGDQSTRAISSKTVFTPTSTLTFKLNYTHVSDNDHIPPTLYADLNARSPITRPDGSIGYYFNGATSYNFSTPSWGPLYSLGANNPGIRHEQDRFSLAYDWLVAGHTVSGYVSHSKEKYNEQLDGSFYLAAVPTTLRSSTGVVTPVTVALPSLLNYDLGEEDTQFEIRVTSPQDQRLRYTFGYNYSDIDGHANLKTISGATIYYSNQYGGSFLNPATDNSVFGGVFFDITKALTVSFSGRYQREKIEAKSYSTATATYGQTLTDFTANYNTFLPQLNLQYRLNSVFQVYATYSEGNNPGGFQAAGAAASAAVGVPYAFAEEKIKNYEAGVKSTWYDGRLVFNAAVFHMDFTHEQLQQTIATPGFGTGISSFYLPGVASKVDGFEAEADAAITHDFQVRGTVGYGKSKYESFCSVPYGVLTGIYTGPNCRSVAGKQQEGTPALQTSFSGDYTHHINSSTAFYVRGDWEYQSKVYNEEWDQSWVPAFSTINARIGIEHNNWTLEGFVKNATNNSDSTRSTRITDSRGAGTPGLYVYPPVAGQSQIAAGEQSIAGTAKKPRQYGVRLNYKF